MTRTTIVDVYVPVDGARTLIDPGSGIVADPGRGAAGERPRIVVDYEGNRFGSSSMVTYADRVHHAAGRHLDQYPTVARSALDPNDLVRVGTFDTETGEIDLLGADEEPARARERIAHWLDIDVSEVDAQLSTEGSVRHQMLREVKAALAGHDPARKFAAEQMARRYKLNV